jgi:von Willebrand factor A domain-containing protein 7
VLLAPSAAASEGQQKGNSKSWPCASKIDPSYIMVAEETGGQVQMFQPSEASGSLTLIESKLAGNDETVNRISGEMSGEKESTILVDPSIESITISTFVQCMKNITIYDPSGAEFLSGTATSKENRFISGRILTLKQPAAGLWKIRMEGTGYYSMIAEAKTELTLTAEFVEIGGRPGHEGYFPIKRQPKMKTEEKVSLRLYGKVLNAEIRILNREGELLQKLSLEASYEGEDSTEYLVPIKLMEEKFRIQVAGKDKNDLKFARMDPRLYHASKSMDQ